jgi:ribosomal-protein-alanine N-acetyltransferase
MFSISLETQRLLLSPFSTTDADALHQFWIDPFVRKFLWDDQIIPLETATEIIQASIQSFADHKFGFWKLSLKGTPELIGFCGLRHMECSPGEASEIEILYGLNPEHWGKGLATEAAAAVLRYGFEEMSLDRICAGADPPNEASFRVMKRLGMRFERRTTIQEMTSEVVADYYALTRAEFLAR